MPVMAPDWKDVFRAGIMPFSAAAAVRTLARTETFMPMKPAVPESTAPMMKPNAVRKDMKNSRSTATTAPTMAMVRYWRLR